MLLWRAAALHLCVRAGLGVLPFPVLRRLLDRVRRPSQAALTGPRPRPLRIALAVEAASAPLSWSTCLSRALTAQALLGRYGYAADLRIGVRRGPGGELQAHAWLVDETGLVLIGDTGDLGGYAQLPPLEGALP
ncbi:MAG: lasso peptide biosynthesis B2 protein [Candidatus Latescibacterota bacterium]